MNVPPPLPLVAHWAESPVFQVAAVLALLLVAFLFFLILFEPGLEYNVQPPPSAPDSEGYLSLVGALTATPVHRDTRVEVLTDGDQFYESELGAIGMARRSISVEFYIFEPGEAARRFLTALVSKAREGVRVRVVLDAIGSKGTSDKTFRELREAGGRVEWYHPVRWYNFKRLNNRTHRDLLIVDGRVGFLGGAGVADHWLLDRPDQPRWRDTMARVEGGAVVMMQSTFAENWLEAAGEILTGGEEFPILTGNGGERTDGAAGVVVGSAPSAGRATRARVLFQTLLVSARRSIHITSPYFLPDHAARRELVRAARDRGVSIKVVTAGTRSDHLLTRRASRRIYGELLEAGIEIHEYQPAMMHAKVMVVDDLWCVLGSTNFDPRSFGHNDEVNLAVRDSGLAARLDEDFARDLARSRAISLEEWRRRPIWERVQEWLVWIVERQA